MRCRAGEVAAVVLGDAGDDLSYRNMDVAFRLVQGGADLLGDAPQPVVVHPGRDDARRGRVRGRASSSRPAAGRRSSASRRPPSSGRPSPGCRRDLGERAPRSAFAMVGDDLSADVAAAQRVGLRGILVLSGKTDRAEADACRQGPRRRGPDGDRPHAGRRRGRARLTATFPTLDLTHEAHHHDHRVQAAHQDHLRDAARRQRGAARRLRGRPSTTAKARARRAPPELHRRRVARRRRRRSRRARRSTGTSSSGTFAKGTAADVDDAVAAARAAAAGVGRRPRGASASRSSAAPPSSSASA